MLSNLEELKCFPNLKELQVSDYCSFTKEQLEQIRQDTEIKTIITNNVNLLVENDLGKEDIFGLIFPIKNYYYRGLNLKNQQSFPKEISHLDFVIYESQDLEKLLELFEGLKINDNSLESINIYTEREIQKRREFVGSPPFLQVQIKNQKIDTLFLHTTDEEEIEQTLQWISQKDLKPEKITLSLQNKTYPRLEKYNHQIPIFINYGSGMNARYEEFMSMRSTIDWYKSLIMEGNLSPAEKLTFAYDIIKSFSYQENHEDKMKSRHIHSIIQSGDIVCRGYAEFLVQLLKKLQIPATEFSVTTKDENNHDVGHARVLVNLDDDKYDIHGVFSLDSTWDSRRSKLSLVEDMNGQKQIRYAQNPTDKEQKSYDGLSLYRNFLVPYEEYSKAYPLDSNPYLFRAIKENQPLSKKIGIDQFDIKSILDEKNYAQETQTEKDALFSTEIPEEEIREKVIYSKKPSLHTFQQMIARVRKEEGYSDENIQENVESTVELNQMLEDLYEKEKTFFQDTARKN